MNKKQIEFLIENGFNRGNGFWFGKRVGNFNFIIYYVRDDKEYYYEKYNLPLSLNELKAERKEIQQFEKLCIQLEALK